MSAKLLPILLSAWLAWAAGASGYARAESWEAHLTEACATWNLPRKLVLAIARHESGLNQWAVNVEGKGYLPGTREEALAIANAAHAAGKSYDLGIMQINSFWLRRFGFSPEYIIEPRRNIIVGAWILRREIDRHGLTWQAVASYHTPVDKNPERARRYALAIINRLKTMRPEQ